MTPAKPKITGTGTVTRKDGTVVHFELSGEVAEGQECTLGDIIKTIEEHSNEVKKNGSNAQ